MEKDPRTHAIIGAAIEVHSTIGPGHLEAVYHECLEIEFQLKKIPYKSKPSLKMDYKGVTLKKEYIPDFLVYDEVILEIKSEKYLTQIDMAQIINSLKRSNHKTGLLVNFGEQSLKFKRFIN